MDTPGQVVEKWVAAFNERDAHAAAALYHDDATNFQVAFGEPTVGKQQIFADHHSFFRAFPDNETHIENLFEDGEWAILEWWGRGTWTGPRGDVPGNGRSATLRGCGFFHVTGGKIAYQRGYIDRATWFEQLGIPL